MANDFQAQLRSKLRDHLVARQVGQAGHDAHAKGAIHFDPAKVDAEIQAFEPKVKAFLDNFGPVLPAQFPVVVNAILAIYDAFHAQPAAA